MNQTLLIICDICDNAKNVTRTSMVVAALAILSFGIVTTARAETIGYWRFEEGTNGGHPSTTADEIVDSSGKGNHGTAQNVTYLTYSNDVPGPVIQPGSLSNLLSLGWASGDHDQRIDIPDDSSLDLTNGITIEAFIKPSAVNIARQGIAYKWAAGQESYALRLANNKLRFILNDGTSSVSVESSTSLSAGTWTHVAATWNDQSDTMKLYIDGVVDTSTASFSGPINQGTEDLHLGICSGDDYTYPFSGLIDEVRISSQALGSGDFLVAVPEPSTILLLVVGLLTLVFCYYRRPAHAGRAVVL